MKDTFTEKTMVERIIRRDRHEVSSMNLKLSHIYSFLKSFLKKDG